MSRPLHISHRGGSALAPENTLVAFDLAVSRYHTDMLEIDVQATADGVLVVAHDDTVDRCTGFEGRIASLPFEAVHGLDAGFSFTHDGGETHPFRGLRVHIPSLTEVLETFRDVRFNIDLKPARADLAASLSKVVRDAGAASRVCVGSEDDGVAGAIVQALPEAEHFYPKVAAIRFVTAVRTGQPAPDDEPYRALDLPMQAMGMRVVDEALVEAAAKVGRTVNVWTVDEAEEMRELVRIGVGGIITDRPDVLRAVLDEAG